MPSSLASSTERSYEYPSSSTPEIFNESSDQSGTHYQTNRKRKANRNQQRIKILQVFDRRHQHSRDLVLSKYQFIEEVHPTFMKIWEM